LTESEIGDEEDGYVCMCVCMYVDRIDLDDDVKDFLTVDRWFDE
jgi:hypothetical protein